MQRPQLTRDDLDEQLDRLWRRGSLAVEESRDARERSEALRGQLRRRREGHSHSA